jgi:hypothetical protein
MGYFSENAHDSMFESPKRNDLTEEGEWIDNPWPEDVIPN